MKSWLFVHNPKTGGTSIAQSLLGKDKINSVDKLVTEDRAYWSHRTARAWATKDADRWNRSFTFGICRHPVDRLASMYQMYAQGKAGPLRNGRFVISQKDRQQELQRLARTHSLSELIAAGDFLGLPSQASMLCINGRVAVDFVGRCETLREDFARICAILGLPSRPLPHTRQTEPLERLTDDDRRMVYSSCREDFDLFGYEL